MNHRFIAIEGNIGAGKTTLATMLAADFNARLMLEQFADNPFLPLFYHDPSKYAFPLELSFLGERFEQLKQEFSSPNLFQPLVISDYYIIKSLLFASINLGEPEYKLFHKLFHIIHDSFARPDLIIYLNSEVPRLKQNIRERGREYEQNMDENYLYRLQEKYFEMLRNQIEIPVLILPTTDKNFVSQPAVYEQIKNMVALNWPAGIHIAEW